MARTKRKPGQASAQQAVVSPARVYQAGGYIRLSIEDSGKAGHDTIQAQRVLVESFISDQTDMRLHDIYCDNGQTGTDFDRPAFERMMDDVRAGVIDCIVVKDLSRFGRNYKETGNYLLRIFPLLGVRFISINDHFDTLTAEQSENGFVIPLKNVLNEAYSRDISRKISSAIKTKELRGEFRGVFAPYGYMKSEANHNKLEVNPETAPVVKEIFSLRLQGVGYSGIAKLLNKRGVPCPGAYLYQSGLSNRDAYRDALWSVWNIKEILRDEVYLGRLVQGKRTQESYKQARAERYAPSNEWRIAENTHEALVDEKTFTAVRELADRRAAKAQSNQGKADDLKTPNLFRKLIYCADCGKAMVRRHIYNRRAGCRIYYYSFQCPTSQKAAVACTPKNLKESDLIAAVSDTVRQHLDAVSELEKQVAEKWAAKISDTEQEVMRQIADAERELALSETRVDGLYQSLVSGVIDREEYLNLKRHYMVQCAEKKERLNDWKHKLQEIRRCSPSNPLFAAIQKFKDMDGLTEELTHTLISRIDVHDNGRIDIKLTYQDEIHHLLRSLEEVAAA